MRGDDDRSSHLFSYVSPEQRVPPDHPLRAIRIMTDAALRRLPPRFETLYASIGHPSVPPEQLLRALLLQVLYSIRSERLLMEQLQYNLLFRWFVGLDMDDVVWTPKKAGACTCPVCAEGFDSLIRDCHSVEHDERWAHVVGARRVHPHQH
jgi:hypothetical protein